MSAIKLPQYTNIALNITIPSNNGTSLLSPAETAACPIPGYVKICSTKTAPPNNS